jgi:hypothetical protein
MIKLYLEYMDAKNNIITGEKKSIYNIKWKTTILVNHYLEHMDAKNDVITGGKKSIYIIK